MQSGEVSLRAFIKEDRQALASLCNNKNIWDNVRDYLPHPYTLKDADAFIEFCTNTDTAKNFAITYKNELAGTVGIEPQKDVYRLSAELGYWIGEPFWGKGIATKAVKLITNYGNKELGIIRFFSSVFDFNKGSMRVLEKAGFELEGIGKKAIIKNDVICDEYKYALVIDK